MILEICWRVNFDGNHALVKLWQRCQGRKGCICPTLLYWRIEDGFEEVNLYIKSAVDYMSYNPKILAPKGVSCVAWLAVLMFMNLPAALAKTPCPGIHVQVLNIRNSTGIVACALFESRIGFPTEYLHSASNIMAIKIRKQQARCDFEDIPPGTYAIVVIHDENMNGRLDYNLLHIPKEGYGFSNDAKSIIGTPSFSAASFPYDGQNLELTITLHY